MTDAIKTGRLILRRFCSDDDKEITALVGNLVVSRWLSNVPHPYDLDHAACFLNWIKTDGPDTFAVTRDGLLIGCISIGKELGYWFGERYWGFGYATEAAQAMITRYFETMREPIKSSYHIGNDRSRKVLTKLGFEPLNVVQSRSKALACKVDAQVVMLTFERWIAVKGHRL